MGHKINMQSHFIFRKTAAQLPFLSSTTRTLVQPGKILVPMDDKEAQALANQWRSAPLMKKPIVEEASLPLTRELILIEDLDPESLPSTTEVATHVNPPEKHQQIGLDASKKLLRGFLQGVESPTGNRCAVLVVDLSLHTCEVLKAACTDHLLNTEGLPVYFLGFAAGEEKLEWAKQHFEEWTAKKFLNGDLKIPKSCTLPPATLPPEMREAAPAQPQLNVLTWNQAVKYEGLPTLSTPAGVLTKYHDHDRFGSEFQAVLSDCKKNYPLDLPAESGSASKRQSSHAPPQALLPPQKKHKPEEPVATKMEATFFCKVDM